MAKVTLTLLALLLNLILVQSKGKLCGEENINNCLECGKDDKSNTCGTCEADYFPLLENLLCFSCDDPIYGQAGCKGSCDGSNYVTSSFAYCQECKEGYYNIEGICHMCNEGSPGCVNCTYEKDETDNNIMKFKCNKCLNEREYRINENSRCVKCNEELSNCLHCHYEISNDGNYRAVCDDCARSYYLNSDNKCVYCGKDYMTGGYCYQCSSDCDCNSGYTLYNRSCIRCPNNCDSCIYNPEENTNKCSRCSDGYTLDSEGNCISCQTDCKYCQLLGNNINDTICIKCDNNYMMNNGVCQKCKSFCSQCYYEDNKKEPICSLCQNGYGYDNINNECIDCQSRQETGTGCRSCRYNSSNDKFECLSCASSEYYDNTYAYIRNTYQCLSNRNSLIIGLYGCNLAEYNETTDSYICLECRNSYYAKFIPVINNKSCTNELANCLEAEKIDNSISCTKCEYGYALVEDISTHIKTCYERNNYYNLSFCELGKRENGMFSCTKCVENSALDSSNTKCLCNSDSFSKDTKWCYKCNDFLKGNIGCDESFGCSYYEANDQLNCNKCKKGYFNYTQGQCLSCNKYIPNCGECSHDIINDKTICDSCINSIYHLNKEENICELNECEEYPEISPGCIICTEKLNEYKENNKCQRCKYGYFKTKDEKCVLCSSEKNGGHGCSECTYEKNQNGEDTDNIICKGCYSTKIEDYYHYLYYYDDYYEYYNRPNDAFLTKEGKCYDCLAIFGDKCNQCNITTNEDGKESLKCISCYDGYYLTPEGNCVDFTVLLPKIPNCRSTTYTLGNIVLKASIDEYDYYNGIVNYYYDMEPEDNEGYNTFAQTVISSGIKNIEVKCEKCLSKSFMNDEGNCEEVSFDKCTFNSIFKNFTKLYEPCKSFCSTDYAHRDKIRVYLKVGQNEISIESLNYNYNFEYFKYFGESINIKACLSNSGEGGEYSPEHLKYCEWADYHPNNNTYSCRHCYDMYGTDEATNTCYLENKDNCEIINMGTEILPLYSCYYYQYYSEDNIRRNYTLVTYENNQTEFIEAKGDLEGCSEAVAESTYVNPKYNCTKCTFMYVPYYNKFYDRIICQNIKGKILRENEISFDNFKQDPDKVPTVNGTCEKDYLFTPDGEFCHKCDNNIFGMPGCKGGCNFSLKRNQIINCEGECKEGYIESSKGVCSECGAISKGCHECHYEDEYPKDYSGIKKSRRFVCDFCEEGYMLSASGKCLDCKDLGLDNCGKCEIDSNNTNKYICTHCNEPYFINEKGQCETCNVSYFKGKEENKCYECSNNLKGGIENCRYCLPDGENVICQECLPGYLLLTNNNTCLTIAKNKEIQGFEKCDQLTIDNGKLQCSKCKKDYTLYKKNDINECTYIKSLYDMHFLNNYKLYFNYSLNDGKALSDDYYIYRKNDYIYNKYKDYYPCQEAINLGTEDNPLYSCTKCYINITKNETSPEPVRITERSSNASYCVNPIKHEELKYCTEANYRIKNGKGEYNCTECSKNYILTYNKYSETYYCQFSGATTKCVVLYCKTCNSYDGYKCEECLPDYVVNSISGSCIKKTEVVPAVTWKDIYRLNMNGQKSINSRQYYGPSLIMRGITSSRINTRHAFLIELTFMIKHTSRNLEGEDNQIKMPAICEILKAVEATNDEVNMVEYECIGNDTIRRDLSNYKLGDIKEGNNENELKKSNLNNLVKEIDLDNLENKQVSDFTYEDLYKIIVFKMDKEIYNITANDFKFNFQIDGKLSKDITPVTLERELELAEVDTKAKCKFIIGSNKIANLICDLDVNNHKDISTFSFKTSEIQTDDKNNDIYLAKFNDIELINSQEKEKEDTKLKPWIIAIIVICCVLGAAGIGFGIYFIIKKTKKMQVSEPQTNRIDKNNIQITNNIVEPSSENRVSQYKNELNK